MVSLFIAPFPQAIAEPPVMEVPQAREDSAPFWAGPDEDFRMVEDRIMGPWWQGGGPAVVYFTGPHAQRHRNFIKVGTAIAEQAGRPYLEIHAEHLQPNEEDANGVLLYPDGTARVRLMLMPGGNSMWTLAEVAGVSEPTVEALKAEREKFVHARINPKAAFDTGMNFVGTCGGFFTAASGYNIPRALNAGWNLWPGKVNNIGPGQRPPFPDVVMDPAKKDHPLFQAADNGTLKNMYYNGGPLGVDPDVPDTEYFGKYAGGNMDVLIDDWFCIAYRPADNPRSGRCVITTGHPEVNHPDFLMAMARYALDHEYEVHHQPLQAGETVEGVSGDEQMQYFSIAAEAGQTLTVTLTELEADANLYVRAGLPPTITRHDAESVNVDAADEQAGLPVTKAGMVFIGVHGRHRVLNGTPYTLTVQLRDKQP